MKSNRHYPNRAPRGHAPQGLRYSPSLVRDPEANRAFNEDSRRVSIWEDQGRWIENPKQGKGSGFPAAGYFEWDDVQEYFKHHPDGVARLWTVTEEEDKLFVEKGRRHVNRLAYMIENPAWIRKHAKNKAALVTVVWKYKNASGGAKYTPLIIPTDRSNYTRKDIEKDLAAKSGLYSADFEIVDILNGYA